jgi:murein DD-endopeptidase MepM/ murein hydrolase activator NlpD
MKPSKKFTFVIIPDANSTVKRFEVQKIVLYITGIGLCALIVVTFILSVFHRQASITEVQLKTHIMSQETVYSSAVQEKDETIELLQGEVIRLSEQTAKMKNQIEDIRKLEDEVRNITGSGSRAISAADGSTTVEAMGGTSHGVNGEEVTKVITQTKSQLIGMSKELNELKDSIADTKDKALAAQEQLRITPSMWPVDSRKVTSGFGLRQDPFTFRPSFHSGYDISTAVNSEVHVTADGVVNSTGSDSEHGNNIVVGHANGLQTWYMHLNKIVVNKGDTVTKGQLIGLVGTTGRSTGYHLHYEILKNGISIDPKPYLK